MAYKEPPTYAPSPKVPDPNWSVPKEATPGKGMFDKKVKPAAKPAKADGYMNSGVSKKDFGC